MNLAKSSSCSSDFDLSFSGKVVLITGGASGIGLSTALLFARKRASVVIIDWAEDKGKEALGKINKADGDGIFIKCDVAQSDQARKAIEKAVKKYERIDILFCNAGTYGPMRLVHETPEEEWDRIIAIDLRHVFLFCKYVIPHMIHNRGGTIINNASEAGFLGIPTYSAYCAAKAGIILLIQTLACEYGKYNIRANVVCPASVDTPMMDEELEILGREETLEAIKKRSPFNRLCKPEEVSNVVIFLASEKASFITGQKIVIDGGFTACGAM